MTLNQKIRKAIYPFVMAAGKLMGMKYHIDDNKASLQPGTSFYALQGNTIDGSVLDFSILKGKKILLVNTASDCGYTGQYEELEELHKTFKGKLVVVGFPANDFKEQEKGSDAEIASFCKKNYGVTFTLMKKSVVIKNENQNNTYKWLTDATQNGWNNKEPEWNFAKYLVDEKGVLINYFSPSISPLSEEITRHI